LRLEKQISTKEKERFEEHTQGQSITQVAKELLAAHDPDRIENLSPEKQQEIVDAAVAVFHNPELRHFIVDVRKKYDQIIDTLNIDEVTSAGFAKDQKAEAEKTIREFRDYIEQHKAEITALQIFYGQPYRRRELTYKMIKDLCEQNSERGAQARAAEGVEGV
jgi:type I restriction enzyme R subunit